MEWGKQVTLTTISKRQLQAQSEILLLENKCQDPNRVITRSHSCCFQLERNYQSEGNFHANALPKY